ncbi:hypothetical protein BS78_07G145800 [Paspalum vaginatum]|nr:hypothetical protein BS78_07G145800 [Paspalum vaginatum]
MARAGCLSICLGLFLGVYVSGFSILSTTLKPGTNFFSHIACPVASKQAINSVYIIDDATMHCLQLFHDTASPARVNTYLDVDFLVSLHPA